MPYLTSLNCSCSWCTNGENHQSPAHVKSNARRCVRWIWSLEGDTVCVRFSCFLSCKRLVLKRLTYNKPKVLYDIMQIQKLCKKNPNKTICYDVIYFVCTQNNMYAQWLEHAVALSLTMHTHSITIGSSRSVSVCVCVCGERERERENCTYYV